ncbi:MAG: hypothetical protein ACFFCF_11785 [Promethearchaeota archaeon]
MQNSRKTRVSFLFLSIILFMAFALFPAISAGGHAVAIIQYPSNGAEVSGEVIIRCYIDAQYSVRAYLYIDGVRKQIWTTKGINEYPWDSTAANNGNHQIKLKVLDINGYNVEDIDQDIHTVTVVNRPGLTNFEFKTIRSQEPTYKVNLYWEINNLNFDGEVRGFWRENENDLPEYKDANWNTDYFLDTDDAEDPEYPEEYFPNFHALENLPSELKVFYVRLFAWGGRIGDDYDELTMRVGEGALVVVQHDLWSNSDVQYAVSGYLAALVSDDIATYLHISPLGDVFALKSLLQSFYYPVQTITGAVLLGNLPFALFEKIENTFFACDFFLMDLDGEWIDTDDDNVPDEHIGDIEPEIYVGRVHLFPFALSFLVDTINRFTEYHLSGSERSSNGLVFNSAGTADPNFVAEATAHEITMQGAFDTVIRKYWYETQGFWTYPNLVSWLHVLAHDYQAATLLCHSDSVHHDFKTWGWPDMVFLRNIRDALDLSPTSFNYLYMDCCHAAEFTWIQGCLAQGYLFHGKEMQAVIGHTTSPLNVGTSAIWTHLAKGYTIGKAVQEVLDGQSNNQEYFGLVLLGNPFSTLN